MKKKVLALLLSLALLLAFAACSSGGETSKAPSSKSEGTSSEAASSEVTSSKTTNEGTPSGEKQKVVMAFRYFTGAPAETSKIQDALNVLAADIGVEVELQISDSASYNQNMTLALSGGEQVDILSVSGLNYASLVQQGYLQDLEADDLFSTYGKGIQENINADYIDACRISGVLYGLPQNRDMAQGRGGMVIPTEYLEAINYPLTDDEIIKITQDDLNKIFADLHAAFPDKEVFRPNTLSTISFTDFDQLGGSSFGVLLNNGEKPVVENLFTSDTYIDYCKQVYDWNQLGYISQDAVTDTTSLTELVGSGKLMAYVTSGKPGIKTQESGLSHKPVTIFQTKKDFMASSAISGHSWCIPNNSEDAVAAMKFLNELYSNADYANLLAWGIEGEHYQVLDSGLADFPEGVDASTSGYYHPLQWMLPNQYITYVWNGNDPEMYQKLDEFNDGSVKSCALGFTFDTSAVATELTALQNVYDEYQKSIEFGMVEPEAAIAEMNAKMEQAGLQNVIDEKQKQLDEFMATKG